MKRFEGSADIATNIKEKESPGHWEVMSPRWPVEKRELLVVI